MLFSNSSKFISAASVSLLAFLSITPSLKSQEIETAPSICPNNPSDLNAVNGFCVLTPEQYGVKIYEMGLCTSNPITSDGISKESCYTSLVNNNPVFTDVAKGKSFTLKSQKEIKERPKAADYTHAYIVISPEFQLKFTYKINGINYYSDGVNSSAFSPTKNATITPPAKSFIETLNDFGDPEEGFSPTAKAEVTGGVITALLTDGNLQRSTSAAQTSRLVGVFVPAKPITITNKTNGLEVKFVVTNQGGGAESCASFMGMEEEERRREGEERRGEGEERRGEGPPEGMDQVCRFGSGPFSAIFSPF